jgi:N-acetylglucosaminyldiphosphoundecaprenol N-acetyl-beta-D-mannosaminyltransferase
MGATPRVDILGVGVDAQTLDEAVGRIEGWVERGEPNYVCVTGVHGVMCCQDDPELRRIHHEAGMVTADGVPLVWLSRRRVRAEPELSRPVERVYGPDLMLRAFARSERVGWRHFLFGSTPKTLDRLAGNLARRFPHADVVGALSPPFGPVGDDEDRAMTATIARARPDVVWVGLSTPKQERWMARHVGRVHAPVLVGVGAAFDFHAGTKPQAPRWMQRAGVEWAFRAATEPRRLAGRYIRNNPRFVMLCAREVLGKRQSTWNYPPGHCE